VLDAARREKHVDLEVLLRVSLAAENSTDLECTCPTLRTLRARNETKVLAAGVVEAVMLDPALSLKAVDRDDTLVRNENVLVEQDELLERAHNRAERLIIEEVFFKVPKFCDDGQIFEARALLLLERKAH